VCNNEFPLLMVGCQEWNIWKFWSCTDNYPQMCWESSEVFC
jgi:hypothetical protein